MLVAVGTARGGEAEWRGERHGTLFAGLVFSFSKIF